MRSNLNMWLVCRICLKQPKEMETIFNTDMTKDMTQMIYECGGVPIKQFDHYPDKICINCSKQLRVAYKFRTTCQRSHKQLSHFLAPVVLETTTSNAAVEESETELSLEVDVDETIGTAAEMEPVPSITLNEDETELEVTLKVEANGELEVEEIARNKIKTDNVVHELSEFVDVFEPMVDEDSQTEFVGGLERSVSVISEPVEYLDDFVDEVFSTDEEYLPEGASRKLHSKKKIVQLTATTTATLGQKSSRIGQIPTSSKEPRTYKMKQVQIKKEMRKKKPKETSYICDICGNIYPTQGRLTEHIKLHKGIKPHECEICGHAFAQTQQLARHMNTHTGNRPYKCNYCPAAFADLSTRNKHHRIHTNERPYVCDVCGKSFTYTNTLKFHKMIHTGEKPHVCDYCGKGFQQAYKLRNHKLTHEKKMGKVEKLETEASSSNTLQEVHEATAQIMEM